ncbi:MAG TPA: hypothetical protein VGH27_16540 [Streptosporangiaceae bacterium]
MLSTARPDPHTLAGACVLDALTGVDRTRCERHLIRCLACADEVGGFRETAARLAAAAAVQPPGRLKDRVLAAAPRIARPIAIRATR